MTVLPAGWAGAEPELIVAAVNFNGYEGHVYGWPASKIVDSASSDDATTLIQGPPRGTGPFGPSFGSSVAWLGDATTPITAIGATGGNSGRGEVYGWVGPDVLAGVDSRSFRITGTPGPAFATHLLSDTDLDGDGLGELIVGATVDSRVASNAGSVVVFFDADTLSGELADTNADVLFNIGLAGVHMFPISVGDADLD